MLQTNSTVKEITRKLVENPALLELFKEAQTASPEALGIACDYMLELRLLNANQITRVD